MNRYYILKRFGLCGKAEPFRGLLYIAHGTGRLLSRNGRELTPLLRCRQCDHKGGEIRVSTVGYKPSP
jgi:hypothetical protein